MMFDFFFLLNKSGNYFCNCYSLTLIFHHRGQCHYPGYEASQSMSVFITYQSLYCLYYNFFHCSAELVHIQTCGNKHHKLTTWTKSDNSFLSKKITRRAFCKNTVLEVVPKRTLQQISKASKSANMFTGSLNFADSLKLSCTCLACNFF